MKKLFALALIVLFAMSALYVSSVSAAPAGPGVGDILGQGKYDWQPHKIYRFVRFVQDYTVNPSLKSGGVVTATSVVLWDLSADDGVTVTIRANTAAGVSCDSSVAGVLVSDIFTQDVSVKGATAQEDYGRKNWGWMQTYGLTTVRSVGAWAEGDLVAPATKPGACSQFPGKTISSTSYGVMGVAVDAGTADLETDIILRGLD